MEAKQQEHVDQSLTSFSFPERDLRDVHSLRMTLGKVLDLVEKAPAPPESAADDLREIIGMFPGEDDFAPAPHWTQLSWREKLTLIHADLERIIDRRFNSTAPAVRLAVHYLSALMPKDWGLVESWYE